MRPALVAAETDFLRNQRVSLVLTDVTALCLPAARKANITSAIVSNFTWDYIYSAMFEVFSTICMYLICCQGGFRPFSSPLNTSHSHHV